MGRSYGKSGRLCVRHPELVSGSFVGTERQKKFRNESGMTLFNVLKNYLFLDDLDFLFTSFLLETAQTMLIT